MTIRTHRTAFAAALLSGLLLAAGALAEGPDDLEVGTTSLDSVDTGDTDSLDSLDTGATGSLDSVDTGTTSDLDSVDAGDTDSLDSLDTGTTTDLDSIESDGTPEPGTRSFNPSTPPNCEQVSLPEMQLPEDSDYATWGRLLHQAEQRVEHAGAQLEMATAQYTRVRNDPSGRGQKKMQAEMARNAARTELAEARCALPALVDAARRAGVPAGIIRSSVPASASGP